MCAFFPFFSGVCMPILCNCDVFRVNGCRLVWLAVPDVSVGVGWMRLTASTLISGEEYCDCEFLYVVSVFVCAFAQETGEKASIVVAVVEGELSFRRRCSKEESGESGVSLAASLLGVPSLFESVRWNGR